MLRGTEISIHAPLTGRDVRQVGLCLLQRLISIHVPPTGHDTQSIAYLYECLEFQSTCPVRGTTVTSQVPVFSGREFQSSCPVRGTTQAPHAVGDHRDISILVPRTGHDQPELHLQQPELGISILVPRTGHDECLEHPVYPVREFQSSCPVRGTTTSTITMVIMMSYFNPRAPYGARLYCSSVMRPTA